MRFIQVSVGKIFANRTVNILVKLLIFIATIAAVYFQLDEKLTNVSMLEAVKERFLNGDRRLLLAAVLLIPVNWGLETLKFKELTQRFLSYSFWRLYQAILAGVAVSMITPNRIGEYGGRILLVEARYNWRSVVATLVGSFSQLLALLGFGILGLSYFSGRFLEQEPVMNMVFVVLGVVLVLVLLFVFFNIDLLAVLVRRIPGVVKLKKWLRPLRILKHYSGRTLRRTLFFSALRYLTYSSQYFLILYFFNGHVPFLDAFAAISTIFLIHTSLPIPPLSGLMTRSAIALAIWDVLGLSQSAILGTTFLLYLLNLVIPALLGLLFILKVNIARSLGMNDD